MAQARVRLEAEAFLCSVCLDLLRDPVTILCGHSYCEPCIQVHWDQEGEKTPYSCPQCRHTFTSRPQLNRNTMLAVLVDELQKCGRRATADHPRSAGREDVACDVCGGQKLKAVKSCLVCLASYCEEHVQPHYSSAPLHKHQLVEPSRRLQENICSRHHEAMKMFCRTDGQCMCFLCSVDQHKGHDVVSAVEERAWRQKELDLSRQEVQRSLQDKKENVKVLEGELEAVKCSADAAVEDSVKMLSELVRLLQDRTSDVEQQIRRQQRSEERRVRELQETLRQEVRELEQRDAELEQLSSTQDHVQFLLHYSSATAPRPPAPPSSVSVRPLRYFEDVTAAVSKVGRQLQDLLTETWTNVSQAQVDALLSQLEPRTREEFLRYSQELTLDLCTAHPQLLVSGGGRRVEFSFKEQLYPPHPDRFAHVSQILSEQGLTGHRYWEVEWRGGGVTVAVTYGSISRTGLLAQCGFGRRDESWALFCDQTSCDFGHNGTWTKVSGGVSPRIGVYLDHAAGVLTFYSVSDTMTPLHRVQTRFTEPLYAGLRFHYYPGDTAQFCELGSLSCKH